MDHSHHEHSHHQDDVKNEVKVNVNYDGNKLFIDVKDENNKAPELTVSHEEIFHLIIVSANLEQYYHLHPLAIGDGLFEQEIDLKEGLYKVFVDISPKYLGYQITPIDLQVNDATQSEPANLQPESVLQKTKNNVTVDLHIDKLRVNEPATLSYEVSGGTLQPYLGALGHVIILDEKIEQFIHVHPVADDKTIFHAQFTKKGTYKVWAEFKVEEEVLVFPFVIEVK